MTVHQKILPEVVFYAHQSSDFRIGAIRPWQDDVIEVLGVGTFFIRIF
jgi:hypothetical protein